MGTWWLVQDRRAHPRSRGEHRASIASSFRFGGSSPLARGTLWNGIKGIIDGGLIPARAGNTHVITHGYSPSWAHPRSRGEHRFLHSRTFAPGGSSPLARGTQILASHTRHSPGLIPARAGNTCLCCDVYAPGRAHPRSRGEHIGTRFTGENVEGSSPLARGTLFRVLSWWD